MSLKPWREVITPHEDVLHGTFQESEFAADLTKVVRKIAAPEYQDPVLFFQRTFITEGMGRLLESVLRRLSGKGGDPVVQLQTAFGGGKTHTMMAVYHIACGDVPARSLQGVPALLESSGVDTLPRGRVAVIDGNDLGPAQARTVDGLTLRTLWGEIAYQLGGHEGYEMVRPSDEAGTSPGKEILARLLGAYAPCVVLIDEGAAYLRQFKPGTTYSGGTFESNLSFIQALTEAATAVPQAMVLGSLPESIMEVGDQDGQRALDSLEKYFGRIEAVWKPVEQREAFEIVRRRLFQPLTDDGARDAVCQAFADYYLAHAQDFPAEVRDASYHARLAETYPIHPEVFTRLYEDWSTLPKFQKTRGVLRLMARLIYRLWNDGNKDLMILPGSFALYDRDVRTELIKYLPGPNWDAIVERDVDGKDSEPSRLDDENPALGQLQACRRAARAIFLGSAPSSSAQKVRGIGAERVRLGSAQPPQSPGRYDDALRRLADKLHYLYSGNDRYWYDARPNLRREMEDRMQRFSAPETYLPVLRGRLEALLAQNALFKGVHVFRDSADVPDDLHLRLVVLAPETAHRRREASPATKSAAACVQSRGSQPRLHQNRLVFLAPDADQVAALRTQTRAFLAWDEIVRDAEQLNLDPYHQKQAKESRQQSEARMMEALQQAYRWLLAPRQEASSKGISALGWDEEAVERSLTSFADGLQRAAIDAEMVIVRWAPVHLKRALDRFYFDDERPVVETAKLRGDMARHPYFARLRDADTLATTIAEGVTQEDFYGLASGYDAAAAGEAPFTGLVFGGRGSAYFTEGEVLVAPQAARAARQAALAAAAPAPATGTSPIAGEGVASYDGSGTGANASPGPSKPASRAAGHASAADSPARPTRFYGTVTLDPLKAKDAFGEIMDEVAQHFASVYGTEVTIRVEIQADDSSGFNEQTERTVRANAATLGFTQAEFE